MRIAHLHQTIRSWRSRIPALARRQPVARRHGREIARPKEPTVERHATTKATVDAALCARPLARRVTRRVDDRVTRVGSRIAGARRAARAGSGEACLVRLREAEAPVRTIELAAAAWRWRRVRADASRARLNRRATRQVSGAVEWRSGRRRRRRRRRGRRRQWWRRRWGWIGWRRGWRLALVACCPSAEEEVPASRAACGDRIANLEVGERHHILHALELDEQRT